MSAEINQYNLIQMLVVRSRLPLLWVIIIVTVFLALLLVLARYLDNNFADLSTWGFWQKHLTTLMLVVYILSVQFFIWRLRNQAIQAIKPLLDLDESETNHLATEAAKSNRRGELISILIGVGLAVGLGQPWVLEWGPGELWLSASRAIANVLLNGLLFWLIYDTLTSVIRIARLCRHELQLDIFETELLTPVAKWSLGISLVFVGGTSLSLVFQTQENLLQWQTITMYAILIIVILLIFFLSMWSVHMVMDKVKKRKLILVKRNIVEISRELEKKMSRGLLSGAEELSSNITSLATYQRMIQAIPVWPFNADIIRKLAVSMLAPVAIFLLKILDRLGIGT